MKPPGVAAALLLVIVLALLAFGPPPQADAPAREVVRACYDDPALLRKLAGWLEPWEIDRKAGCAVLEVSREDEKHLAALGFRLEADPERTALLNRPQRLAPGQTSGVPGYPCFRTVNETLAAGQGLAAAYPGLAAWIDIGDSWEKSAYGGAAGADLRVLRITNAAAPGPKARLFAMSGLHARELATAELLTRFAETLLSGYGSDPDITYLLDTHEIHLLLQSNPDGRRQAETGLFWRKNTDERFCAPASIYRGVDLNRNFSFYWNCCGGSSGDVCSDLYRGPIPSSEPEVTAVQAYLRAQFPDRRGDGLNAAAPEDVSGLFLDIHSYGREILWPWGFTSQPPANGAALQTLARRLAYFNRYDAYQSYGLYPIDGASDDFAYGELGLAAYTVELGDAFFESCYMFENNILPDNLKMLRYAARASGAPYQLPAGPDVTGVELPGIIFPPLSTARVSAILNDTRFFSGSGGNEPVQPIAAAEYSLGAPPGAAGALATGVFAPQDGAWDEPIEAAWADIDLTGVSNGRYLLYLRARDAAGNWGPVTARFLVMGLPVFLPEIYR